MINKLTAEKIIDLSKVLVLAMILGFGGHFLFAQDIQSVWQEPAATAPDGQVFAPLNVGETDQYKEGGLAVGGPFLASMNAAFEGNVEFDRAVKISGGFPEPGRALVTDDDEGTAVWAKLGGYSSFTAGGEVTMTPGGTAYLSTEGVTHSDSFGIKMSASGTIVSISGSSQVSGFDAGGRDAALEYQAGVVGGDVFSVETTVSDITSGVVSASRETPARDEVSFEAGDMIFIRQTSDQQTYDTNSIVHLVVRYDDVIQDVKVNIYPALEKYDLDDLYVPDNPSF